MRKHLEAIPANRQSLNTVVAIALLFAITVLCYWPSLDGAFIFDDAPNLSELGHRGGLDSFDAFMEFVSTGQSGPLGRPLSLATFALNAQDWPADPLPFRITNLLIHLVNGLLVFFLSRSLLSTTHDAQAANRLGLACMALWLLHPLAASTTAYIIQRMTQLSGLFVLAGLLCYVHGRRRLADDPRAGWLWVIVGMGLSGLLAILSKENGVLLPLYALVIELTVFRGMPLPFAHRRNLVALLCVPLVLVVGYIAWTWQAMLAGFEFRPFSVSERLFTQAVVLVEYLGQVFFPSLSGLGIVHDDFPISTSLFNPLTTFASLVLIVILVGGAIWNRKRWPLASFGILWYFAGHSLEAAPLPLEIYFDHRNYLPLLGPVIAVVSAVPSLPLKARRFAPMAFALFLAFEAFLTWQSARLWANEDLMMSVALIDHPGSLRAQQHVANRHILAGEYEQALEVQQSIARSFPDHSSTRLSILNLKCLAGTLTDDDVDAIRRYLLGSDHDQQIIGFFTPLLTRAESRTCAAFGLAEFQLTLDALLQNPVIGRDGRMRGAVHYFKGIALHLAGDVDAAVSHLDRSYEAVPEIDIRIQQIVWLLESGRANDAEQYLRLARQDLAGRRWTRRVLNDDLQILHERIISQRRASP